MALPESYSASPGEEPHHYFRNVCIEFRKAVVEKRSLDDLDRKMEKFINASKQMEWKHPKSGTYRKDEGVKAAEKVWKEFKRFHENTDGATEQDLVEAIMDMERLIDSLEVK